MFIKDKLYYLKHDKMFMKNADLRYFNKDILDIKKDEENEYILNKIKDAPENSNILDIGAYNGDTSIYLSKRLKEIGRSDIKIHCFEPNRELCNKIKESKESDDLNIEIYETIISNKNQRLYMKKDEGAGTMYDVCYDKCNKSYESKTLDDYNILNVYFCKIDVEGHEPEVLEGGKNTLGKVEYIYIEMWNDEHFVVRHKIKRHGSHNKRILNQIKRCNVNLYPIKKIEKNILFKKIEN